MFEIWEDFSTAFHFPHAGLVIVTSGHNLPVIRAKTSGVNPALMLQGRPNGFAVGCIPDLCGIIAARGNNQPAVVTEGGIENRASVALKLQFLLPGAEFPDASNVILAPGDDPRAIGTESGTENAIGMRQRQRSFTRAQVPDTGGSVVAGSRDPSSAGIPGSACQPFAWPEGVADGFARCEIENPGLTERFDDEDSFAVGSEPVWASAPKPRGAAGDGFSRGQNCRGPNSMPQQMRATISGDHLPA